MVTVLKCSKMSCLPDPLPEMGLLLCKLHVQPKVILVAWLPWRVLPTMHVSTHVSRVLCYR